MKSAIKAIKDLEKFIHKEAKKELKRLVDNTANDARTLAPSSVAGTITVSETDNGARIQVTHPHAAYIEFGTGQKVFNQFSPTESYDEAEYKRYAREFYVDGTGRAGQHPFLFPVLFRDRDMFIQNLKAAIEKEYSK